MDGSPKDIAGKAWRKPYARHQKYMGLWSPPTRAQNAIALRRRAMLDKQAQLDLDLARLITS